MTKSIFSGISALALASLIIFGAIPFVDASSGSGKHGNKVEDDSRKGKSEFRLNSISFEKELKANLILNSVSTSTVTGTAKIKAERKTSGLFETKIDVEVRRLMASTTSTIYEAWLVDDQTGYKLSLGGLIPNGQSNRSKLHFEEYLVNLSIYDKLIVTEEPMNDTNPNPGNTILSASIPSVLSSIGMKAKLSGGSEVPATTSTARGEAKFLINTQNNTLQFEIKVQGLNGVETGAHIHGPATTTQNAGVLFTLPTGTIKIGTWNYSESQEADILAGRTYVNVHSDKFPNGEIRGQIMIKS